MLLQVQGFFGLPGRSAYGASKHAVKGYFDSLRAEVAKSGITVTVGSPGYIRTELSQNAVNADGSRYGATDATTDRGAEPSEVARRLLAAAVARKSEVLVFPGLSATVAILLRTLAPNLLFSIMEKRATKLTSEKKDN